MPMEGWIVAASIVTAIAGLVAAGAATWLAVLNRKLVEGSQAQVAASQDQVRVAQEQVKVSQDQVAQSVKAQQELLLPVLKPVDNLEAVPRRSVEQPDDQFYAKAKVYDPGWEFAKVNVENAGSGIAFNVRGVIFGPEPEVAMNKVPGFLHSRVYPMPVKPGEQPPDQVWKRGGPPLIGDVEIGNSTRKCKLYAPKQSTADAGTAMCEARLTLTYSDVFGRKHAALFNFTTQKSWEMVAYLPDIDMDLADIEREALRALPYGAPRISADDVPRDLAAPS